MVMESFFSLVSQIFGDIKVGVLSRFDNVSVDFEGKCSKVAVVDSSTCSDILFDVLSK